MASSDGVKEPHSFLSYSVGFPSAALIPVAKELLRNLMCMRSVRLLSPLPYHKEAGRVEADNRSNIKVRVQWYYRPEESMGGRRQFHGAKELFLSDHYDVQSAHTIEGKCTVHSFKNYTKLENVGTEDYYCRFEYKAATGAFTPDRVAVYCKCEMPYNPDDLMVQCEGCKDWYHPACVNMTIEQAKMLDHFMCSDCSSDNDIKKPQNTYPSSPLTNGKITATTNSGVGCKGFAWKRVVIQTYLSGVEKISLCLVLTIWKDFRHC